MDINLNVNVKFEETPALINCFSTALQATVGALAVATTTSHTVAAEEAAPAKSSRKSAKSVKATPAMPADEAPAVEHMQTPAPDPETIPVQAIEVPAAVAEAEKAYTLDDVKAICMDFIKKNPDKKAKLAECFQQVGATKLSDTPAEKYAELVQLVQAL